MLSTRVCSESQHFLSGVGDVWGEVKASIGPTSACCLAKMVHTPLICPLISFFLQSVFVSTRIILQHLETGKLPINFSFVAFVEMWQLWA